MIPTIYLGEHPGGADIPSSPPQSRVSAEAEVGVPFPATPSPTFLLPAFALQPSPQFC